MPAEGGEETQVLGRSPRRRLGKLGAHCQWYLFPALRQSPTATIQFLDFATNKTIPIWTLEKEPGWGLASRDGKSIVYVQNEFAESNISW